jgi:hypothetical protein
MTMPDPPDDPREPTVRPISELIDSWLASFDRRRASTRRAEPVVEESLTAWPRWHAYKENDAVVGAIAEEREWLGHTYGPTTYTAVHNPGLRPGKARWRAEGFARVRDAIEAVAVHLRQLAHKGPASVADVSRVVARWCKRRLSDSRIGVSGSSSVVDGAIECANCGEPSSWRSGAERRVALQCHSVATAVRDVRARRFLLGLYSLSCCSSSRCDMVVPRVRGVYLTAAVLTAAVGIETSVGQGLILDEPRSAAHRRPAGTAACLDDVPSPNICSSSCGESLL